jgi:hypothetical protein
MALSGGPNNLRYGISFKTAIATTSCELVICQEKLARLMSLQHLLPRLRENIGLERGKQPSSSRSKFGLAYFCYA